ncbi:YjbF family lipoprotein [Ruegeria sediminis]|nr:YjbF family lipoprotein [Ruegeria sediminis]
MRRIAVAAALLTLLAACTKTNYEFDVVRSTLQPGKAPPDPRVQALIAANAPRLQIAFLESGLAGAMVLEGEREGVRTWLSVDGASLLTRQGLIVGERGFGGGMMASDVSQPLEALFDGREGQVLRFHSFLNGDDRIVTRSYKCHIEDRGTQEIPVRGQPVATRLMRETCRSADQEFLNVYWFSQADGQLVQSRQWLGDFLGVVTLREIAG